MSVHTTPDSYTKFLLQSETSNGSTTFVDSSATSHTVVTNGDPAHSTTQAKFGSTSIHCDATADGFGAAASSEFELGTQDWTLDFWWYPTSIESENYFLQTTGGYTMLCLYYPSSNGWKIIHNNPSSWQTTVQGGAGTLTANVWHHIAFVRSANYHTVYLDGAIVAGPTEDTRALTSTTTALVADGYMAGNVTGYIEEYRLSVGIARWSDTFVPPNKPYSVLDDDFVTDVAGIEDDGAGNTTFGRDIVVKSNPDEASTDSVFSVSAKDGTNIMDIQSSGQISWGMKSGGLSGSTGNWSGQWELISKHCQKNSSSGGLSADTCFTNDYVCFKIIIPWIGHVTDSSEAMFQLTNGGANISTSQIYGNRIFTEHDTSTIHNVNYNNLSEIVLFNNVWSATQGGYQGEINIYNVSAPSIIRHEDEATGTAYSTNRGTYYRPYIYWEMVGYDTNYGYGMQVGNARYNIDIDASAVDGFAVGTNSGNQSDKSHLYVYGLRA